MLIASRWTLRRRIVEFGLKAITGFSMISDGQLFGRILIPWCQSLGLRVQRDRIRESIGRVDPGNSRIRWAVVISRKRILWPVLIACGTLTDTIAW